MRRPDLADKNNMQDEMKELAAIMSFQQSLLRLVTQDLEYKANESLRAKGPSSESTQQLEALVRRVLPKSA